MIVFFADIYIMWLVPILISSQVILSLSAPATDSSSSFRSKSGVTLNGRKKVHGEGEKCPSELTHYCKCRARGEGLDITCEKVNSDQLHVRLHFGEKISFLICLFRPMQIFWREKSISSGTLKSETATFRVWMTTCLWEWKLNIFTFMTAVRII